MKGALTFATAGSRVRAAAIPAAVALVAVAATFISVAALCRAVGADGQPAIVAAVIALALARRPNRSVRRHLASEAALIVTIAPVAAGVGWLLHAQPVAGAIVFTGLLSLSVYGRNFGPRVRMLSAWIALPLVAILVVPPPAPRVAGGLPAELALTVAAGVMALVCVRASARLARLTGVLPTPQPELDPTGPRAATARAGWSPASRMALQMAVAVGAGFSVGMLAFPAHRGWSVLTAFIVCGGARGRGDALYTGILRLLGALGGTIAAAALAPLGATGGPLEALAIFAILYVGLTLRDLSYAYWAACMTLILALLAPAIGEPARVILEPRLAAILAGAVCAVAAAWFVTPIRTEAVVRRRLADALLALDELLANPHPDETAVRHARFEHRMSELDGVAPPVEWHRRLFVVAPDAEHPANWIASARKLRAHARAVTAAGVDQPGPIRRAIGLCRRAIANHGKADAPPDASSLGRSLAAIDAAFAQATAAQNLGSR